MSFSTASFSTKVLQSDGKANVVGEKDVVGTERLSDRSRRE